ncbi:hypothetical protein LEMLEM_LOCUS22965 [Lemmus lemmus]
MCRTLQMLM